MNRREFVRIYNSFYVFLESVVSPTAVSEEKGSRDPGVRRGRQWGAGARRRRGLGCVEGRDFLPLVTAVVTAVTVSTAVMR
jgi:hypothetical protein